MFDKELFSSIRRSQVILEGIFSTMLSHPVGVMASKLMSLSLGAASLVAKQTLSAKYSLQLAASSFGTLQEIARLDVALYDLECEHAAKLELEAFAKKLAAKREAYLTTIGTLKPDLLTHMTSAPRTPVESGPHIVLEPHLRLVHL